jgi:hypothetical protein
MTQLPYSHIPTEKLAEVFSKSITTMDGLWFLAVEGKYGFDAALELDEKVWEKIGPIQARRMVNSFAIEEDNPIRTLIQALQADSILRIYGPQATVLTDNKAIFRCTDCPPQKARVREGKGEFPCKRVGVAFFKSYAEAIDPRIKMTCLVCPPDAHPPQYWCEWQFEI